MSYTTYKLHKDFKGEIIERKIEKEREEEDLWTEVMFCLPSNWAHKAADTLKYEQYSRLAHRC